MKKKSIILGIGLAIIVGFLAIIQYFGPILGPIFLGKTIYIVEPSPSRIGQISFIYMDNMGLYSSSEKWQKERENFKEKLEKSKDKNELKENLEKALTVAGGKHSFVMDTYSDKEAEKDYKNPEESFEDDILYVKVPDYMGNDELGNKYANRLAGFFNKDKIDGVIVDLRGNTGGDMGPMLAGLSPILKDGELMYFKSSKTRSPVKLEDGENIGGGSPTKVDYKKKLKDIPIGVLTDEKTASSAEALLVILKAYENVKVFGKPSAGFVSANMSFNLTKDMVMVLTISNYQAIDGKVYPEEPIEADFLSESPLDDAKKWIKDTDKE